MAAGASWSRNGGAWRRPAAPATPSSAWSGRGPAGPGGRRQLGGQALQRQLAVARLRARLRRAGPHDRAHAFEEAGPLARAQRLGGGDVELHLHPAQGAVGVLSPGAARRRGPPRDLRQGEVQSPLHVQGVVSGHPTSVRAPGYAPEPWTTDTLDARACSSPPSRTATGSPMAARSRRMRRRRACRRHSTPASRPSTRPTSTPSARRNRCSAGRSSTCGASRSRSSPRSTGRPAPTPTTAACRASTSSSRSTPRSTRLQTDHVDLLQAHRYDYADPAGRDAAGLRRPGAPGQGPLHRRLRVDGRADSGRAAPGRRNGVRPHRLQPAAVLADLAGDRGRGGPAVTEGRRGADRLVPSRPGHPHRQVPPRPVRAAGGVAGDRAPRAAK